MKALLLDAHVWAAVAVVQSLGRKSVEVHALARSACPAFASRHATRRILVDADITAADLLERVKALDVAEEYTLVVAASEFSLGALQLCADDDPLRRKAVLPARDNVDIALDKARTWSLALSLGIPVPSARTLAAHGAAGCEPAYPVVLKAVRSQVLREGRTRYAPVQVAGDFAEREAFVEEWGPYTAIQQQDYFAGRGWGVECLYDRGKLLWCFAHERLHELPLTGGASTYRRAAECPEPLLRSARTVLDALDWHGVVMVEFRVNPAGEHVLLEINPRLWGSLPLAVSAGVDFPLGLLTLAGGEHPGAQPRIRSNVRMRNLPADLDWMRANWAADRTNALLATRPRGTSLLEWGRLLLGAEAWDHFSFTDIGPGVVQLRDVAARLWRAGRKWFEQARELRTLRHLHVGNLVRLRNSGWPSRRVVFICHGNICRSPLAGQFARDALPGWTVESSGTHAQTSRATPNRISTIALEFGIDLRAHRAQSMRPASRYSDALLVVMDPANFRALLELDPAAQDQVLFLGMFCRVPSLTIADPLRFGVPASRATVAQIEEAVRGLASTLRSIP